MNAFSLMLAFALIALVHMALLWHQLLVPSWWKPWAIKSSALSIASACLAMVGFGMAA